MRLAIVERGHRLPQKLLMGVIRLSLRRRVPDIVRVLLYRREFMGKALKAALGEVMRGPSEWRVSERELFAAFTSRLNQCVF